MARKLGSWQKFGMGLVALTLAGTAAAVPPILSEQGRLFGEDGTPVNNVTPGLEVKFAIYADPSGGTALWQETQNLAVDDGYFSALLGDAANGGTALPADLFDGSVLYLGVTIGSDSEMSPRQPIV